VAGRIVLFGATGYTGDLTARALVNRGAKPVLAARNRGRVETLAAELGGLESAVADVERPDSIRELLEEGDVLISTVGPFTRWGEPAVRAAIASGAHYLDSTGEAPFVRDVFERYGPEARSAGSGLITAFGYDFVPGNLAGALALREAGPAAVRIDVAYFMGGRVGPKAMSGGTRASAAAALASPSFAFLDGRLVTERGARRVRRFDVNGRARPTISFGASENFTLGRLHPTLRDVGTWLGWFGPLSRPLQVMSAITEGALKIPGYQRLLEAAVGKVTGSSGGPDASARAGVGSIILAIASDAAGQPLAEVRLVGVNGYDFTAEILAWAARQTVEQGLGGTGALGPVDAFGLDELEAGAAGAGIARG
jgi:short subunit dehydrogenase-like uncharacterized protein